MKKNRFIVLALVLLVSSNVLVSCYGKFALVSKVYEWNGQVGDKLLNTLVFWGLTIIPVYEAAGFIDACILNVIEYWTGENPLAMKAGDQSIQVVQKAGKLYQITATQNRFDVKVLKGKDTGKEVSMVFHPSENAWYAENAAQQLKLVQLDKQGSSVNVNMFLPNNKIVTVAAQSINSVSAARSILQLDATTVAVK